MKIIYLTIIHTLGISLVGYYFDLSWKKEKKILSLLPLPHTGTVVKHSASAAAWLTHYQPRETAEGDVINNSGKKRKKKKTWNRTRRLKSGHKWMCLLRHGCVTLFNLIRASQKYISCRQIVVESVVLEIRTQRRLFVRRAVAGLHQMLLATMFIKWSVVNVINCLVIEVRIVYLTKQWNQNIFRNQTSIRSRQELLSLSSLVQLSLNLMNIQKLKWVLRCKMCVSLS